MDNFFFLNEGLRDSRKKPGFKRGKGYGKCWECSGVSGVDDGFVTGGHPPVPATVALFLLDAGIVA